MPIKRFPLATPLVRAGTAGSAVAAPGVQYGLQDDAWLAAGPGPDTLPTRIGVLKKLGVKIVRYNLRWDQIAATEPTAAQDPTDPAYDWSTSDPVVHAVHEAGLPLPPTIHGPPRPA